MSHPITFTLKGLTFTLDRGHLFLDDREISFKELILFKRGKIDLAPSAPEPTIVDLVTETSGAEGLDTNGGDFDILREALTATNLVGTLADRDADFSVFAPTDAAFIQLARDLGADVADGDEAAALDAILAALEGLAGSETGALDLLKDILLYHVAPDGRTLEELQADGVIATAQGGSFTVDGTSLIDNEPDIEDPSVVSANLEAANGTIQVIDRVLLPIDIPGNSPENVVDIAVGNPDFQILVKALAAAGLVQTVRDLDDVTVFAPTDAAFTQLASDLGFTGDDTDENAVFDFIVAALTDLGDGNPIPLLTDILLYHVSPGAKSADEIDDSAHVETLLEGATFGSAGSELIDNEPDIANPNIVIEDIPASNGAIQAIDRVLIPIDIPQEVAGKVIKGTFKSEHLAGTDGDDEIFGRKGNDKIDGNDGDDLIKGGKGNDLLNGGAGDDVLVGGRGHDRFDFRDIDGHDVVRDLGRGDTILLSRSEFSNFHDLEDAVSFKRHDTIIMTEDGSIRLKGVDEHDFDAHLFSFV